MAIIGTRKEKGEGILTVDKDIPNIGQNQVLLLLKEDKQFFTATNIVLSMVATVIARNTSFSPLKASQIQVKASQIQKISQIGIFSAWEWKRKIAGLTDEGFFTRVHVGLEEEFHPTKKFDEYIAEKLKDKLIEIKQ